MTLKMKQESQEHGLTTLESEETKKTRKETSSQT